MDSRTLIVEDAEASALAAELAQLTGQSEAEAVTLALREKVQRPREIAEKRARVNAIVDEMQKHWVTKGSSRDVDDLYGEDGLPA